MTRYRSRAVLLLFLVLYLTACYTWQGVATTSPVGVIEATQPERVRVTMPDGTQVELENPSVEGDELMGVHRMRDGDRLIRSTRSVPLVEIIQLEVRRYDLARSAGVSGLVVVGLLGALLYGASQGAGM